MSEAKKKLSTGRSAKRAPKKRGRGRPEVRTNSMGWMAKFQSSEDPDEVELVHFPLWAVWVDAEGSISVQPIIPIDPIGKKWAYGEDIDGYLGIEEPEDAVDVLEGDDDDDDDEDDDEDSEDDDDSDDEDEDEDEDDDEEDEYDRDEPEVIDTDGRVVSDAPPAGRASG